MPTPNDIAWIAVITETTVFGWSRATGTTRSAPRPASGGPESLWTALRPLLPARRGAIGLVLSSDFYTQTLRLPERQTAGLPEPDLHRLLAFEAEPFSQLAPDAALVAAEPGASDASGVRAWSLLEVPRADAAALVRAAKADRLRIAAFGPAPAADVDDLAPWADTPPAPLLPASAAVARGGASRGGLRLGGENPRNVALAVVLLLCAAHYLATSLLATSAQRRAKELEASAQRVAASQQQLATVRKQISDLSAARRRAETSVERLARYRGAWPALLAGLTEACSGGAVIQRLTATGPFAATVEAYCADPAEPVRALDRLATATEASGWTIHPHAVQQGAAIGVVRFSFDAELRP